MEGEALIHPDADSSGWNPRHGWCDWCGRVLRVVGTRLYYGTGSYCSDECVKKRQQSETKKGLSK